MRLGGFVFGLTAATLVALISPVSVSAKDCVRAVRAMSDFSIQGDAWTWWQHSQGVYGHDRRPAEGSVLVFKKTGRLGRGHVSLVSAVVDKRTIEVDHTWDRSSKIRRGMTVVDVSPGNDWSEVRVWNEPSDTLGSSVYPTYGFVLPERDSRPSTTLHSTYASNDDNDEDSVLDVAPPRRSSQVAAKPGKKPSKIFSAARSNDSARRGDVKLASAKKGSATRFEARTRVTSAKAKTERKQVAHAPTKPARKRTDHK